MVQALSGRKKKGGNDVEMGTYDKEDYILQSYIVI